MGILGSIIILFSVFVILLFIGIPISVSILISSIFTALTELPFEQMSFIALQKMTSGIESFSLLAIPLFILAGNIMNNGGIAKRLINFSQILVGRLPGSLAHTNVLGNMLFGALSGSAVAAAAAIGGTLSPIQEEENYDKAFTTCVNIASAPSGLLIPPTSAFIVYSTVAGGVSISTLFIAGYIPGILMGLATMVIAYLYAKKHNYPTSPKVSPKVALKTTLDAVPSLVLIFIVIGGILGGIFTATEAAGVAVLYCTLLSFAYKNIKLKDFKSILLKSASTSGIILFLISASSVMSFVMSYTAIPQAISKGILSVSDNKIVIFLLINIILLVVGTFMDITPATLIFTPIFLPIVKEFGMTEVQFGVLLIFNLCLGLMTPPVGSVLFVSCGISKITIEKVAKMLVPYLAALLVILLLITFIPEVSLFLPRLFGLI
ncbi:MAG: TRAP transporter large permease [Oscillospiraceae bacterium]